jgi:hypothetical protein
MSLQRICNLSMEAALYCAYWQPLLEPGGISGLVPTSRLYIHIYRAKIIHLKYHAFRNHVIQCPLICTLEPAACQLFNPGLTQHLKLSKEIISCTFIRVDNPSTVRILG